MWKRLSYYLGVIRNIWRHEEAKRSGTPPPFLLCHLFPGQEVNNFVLLHSVLQCAGFSQPRSIRVSLSCGKPEQIFSLAYLKHVGP